jgi:hypothetical protein
MDRSVLAAKSLYSIFEIRLNSLCARAIRELNDVRRGWLNGQERNDPTSLWELAVLFLRLGATVFGRPAAHIPIMDDEVVCRCRWLSHFALSRSQRRTEAVTDTCVKCADAQASCTCVDLDF